MSRDNFSLFNDEIIKHLFYSTQIFILIWKQWELNIQEQLNYYFRIENICFMNDVFKYDTNLLLVFARKQKNKWLKFNVGAFSNRLYSIPIDTSRCFFYLVSFIVFSSYFHLDNSLHSFNTKGTDIFQHLVLETINYIQ